MWPKAEGGGPQGAALGGRKKDTSRRWQSVERAEDMQAPESD